MTARNEKPSQHESSTDTLINALNIIANVLESPNDEGLYSATLREAAQRLDKLEDMRAKQKTLRDEFAMAAYQHTEGMPIMSKAIYAYELADAMMEARKQ